MRRSCLVLLVCCLSLQLFAEESRAGMEKRLQAQFEGKAVLLRGFPTADLLEYDAAGEPLHPFESGIWTLHGAVLIEAVQLLPERLVLQGRRLAVIFDFARSRLVYVSRQEPLRLAVEARPGAALSALERALARVLLLGEEDLFEQVPPYWQHFLRIYPHQLPWAPEPVLPYDSEGRPRLVTRDQVPATPAPPPPEPLPDGTRVLPISGRIWPPRRIHTPEPSYPPAAAAARVRATTVLLIVVDPQGRPRNLRVDRPFGYGLEEAAVAAVESWIFAPATLDGIPVAVETRVEVSFR